MNVPRLILIFAGIATAGHFLAQGGNSETQPVDSRNAVAPERKFTPPKDSIALGTVVFKPPIMEVNLDCGTVLLKRVAAFFVEIQGDRFDRGWG